MRKTVFCPVLDEQINGSSCLDIVLVADMEASPSILPDGVQWDEQKRTICKSCKYHADIED